jgi:hypothetical protein
VFRSNMWPPSWGSKGEPSTKETLLATFFILDSCLNFFSILKIEAICSSETSIALQRNTWRYIPQKTAPHKHRSENLKPYIQKMYYSETCEYLLNRNTEYISKSMQKPCPPLETWN